MFYVLLFAAYTDSRISQSDGVPLYRIELLTSQECHC